MMLKSIESMSPEKQAKTLIDICRIMLPNAKKIGEHIADENNKSSDPLHEFISQFGFAYENRFGEEMERFEKRGPFMIGFVGDYALRAFLVEGFELPSDLTIAASIRSGASWKRVEVMHG